VFIYDANDRDYVCMLVNLVW